MAIAPGQYRSQSLNCRPWEILTAVKASTRLLLDIENRPTSLEITGLSIVLLGDFNPAIFQPHWFSTQGLIPPTEAREVKDFVVHSELTVFKLPWVGIQTTHKQFIASTAHESHFEGVRDLVVSIFTLLKHTPVRKIGVNLEQHYRFADVERYKEFGHKLAPKEVWRKTLNDPGLVKMVVVQQSRSDDYKGLVQVELEASARVHPGVGFRVNDHFEWPPAEGTSGTEMALKILANEFQNSLAHSRKIIESLVSIA